MQFNAAESNSHPPASVPVYLHFSFLESVAFDGPEAPFPEGLAPDDLLRVKDA